MFERYTEKARRVIFFARYEASQFGSPNIETEHLLLGLLREDKALTNRFFRSHASIESIRKQIESHTTIREKISTSVDLPLSNESKRVLAYASEEAERLGHKHIGSEHLLLGVLREEGSFAAAILKERGLKIDAVREEVSKFTEEKPTHTTLASGAALVAGVFKDLTQLAADGALPPIVARERELDAVIQILTHSGRRNPALIGPPGAGKSAVVHALAQRIALGEAPLRFAARRVLEVDSELLSLWASNSRKFDELSRLLIASLNSSPAILFIDCSGSLAASPGPDDFTPFLRWVLSHPDQQCILAAPEDEFLQATRVKPWLLECFRAVHIRPLDKEAALAVLQSRKPSLEKFHDVTYADAALIAALDKATDRNPQPSSITRFALELLDSAGVMVKSRCENASPEIAQIQKQLRFIADRIATSIANHEFEKARFYSDEERKERENLQLLQEQASPDNPAISEVTPDDIERVLARWSQYPFSNEPT